MVLDTRPVTDSPSDCAAWFRAVLTGFAQPPLLTEEQLDAHRRLMDLSRTVGVFEGDRCVATYRSFDQQVTTVGGAALASNAVTGVTVLPTHRRRGLLSGLITADLAAAKERGDVVSTLIAAEYPIYGRFGFGPVTSHTSWEVTGTRAGVDPRWSGPECGGSISFADGAEVRKLGPGLHDRFRAGQPGAVNRRPLWWQRHTGEVDFGPDAWKEPFHVVYRDTDGEPQGLVTYRSDATWTGSMPDQRATVDRLIATTPAAERALWHFLLSVDWVTVIAASGRGPDDLLPHLLPDPRAARAREHADFLWMRPLDIPRMLEARAYPAAGELVLDVTDPLGLTAGRYLLEVSPQGASCTATTRGPDLSMDTGALSSLQFGDHTPARLAALGRISEERPGAVRRAGLLLHTGRRPWCPDGF
ncbi:GNAT family N-acetyltransferase [Streptomyces sp. ACA25]|uniref:GNAT family N-acetyltransferase n=1 Tax=Streptomyces sp. ACA25 TaxID=3022596 RepID=UPI002307A7E0|nr:GNAT family N-acetyltransferase [Streptomyces sp. ACA25]MDB1087950.1 GNAT family N-acetyltransferase [Streptomyces sp. ACA25]